jgi:hypothetical protein
MLQYAGDISAFGLQTLRFFRLTLQQNIISSVIYYIYICIYIYMCVCVCVCV